MRTRSTTLLLSGALALATLCSVTAAQTYEFDVTDLGLVPGAYLTYGRALNDNGQIVGAALFIPGGMKAWSWTESGGYVILPQPPTITDYAAVDVNNAGVIAGDGGGDSGEFWRYTAGSYEMLGVLPGTPIPRASEINEAGSITGSCYGSSFYYPRHSVLAEVGQPLVAALLDSESFGINGPGQITGSEGNFGYRLSPGGIYLQLPPLGDKPYSYGAAINDAGAVTGAIWSLAEHSDVPFLFTDAGGMQEVGNFGGRAQGVDLNELYEVVGNWEPIPSNRLPWVWSAQDGVRLLKDSIDPTLGYKVRYVYAINESGQILCDAYDASAHVVPLLLTPATTCQPDLGFGGPGSALLEMCGDPLASGKTADLVLDSTLSGALAAIGWSTSFQPIPFAGGTLVPFPPIGVAGGITDANGDLVIPAIPGGAGPFSIYAQGAVFDASQPGSWQISNALELVFLP